MKEIFALSLFILTFLTTITAQITKEQAEKVFAEIPVEQRSKLVERLNLFIELEKNKEWDKSYQMIGKGFKGNIVGEYSLANHYENPKIARFTPTEITTDGERWFMLWGCGDFKSGTKRKDSKIEALWENGDWYFSVMTTAQGLHEEPKSCSHKIKTTK